MEPITLIFLSSMSSGVILGDAFEPIGLSKENKHIVKECTTKTSRSKIYDKELNEYITNEYVDEICIGRYIPPERPILNAIKGKIHHN